MESYEAVGHVKGGRLTLDRARLAQAVQAMSDGPVALSLTRKKATRSLQANAYYFGVLVTLIAKETGQDAESIHEFLKKAHNGKFITLVDPRTGEVIGEEHVGMSTAGLNVNDFYDYVERCRAWAGQFLGLVVPSPDPAWRTTE